MNWTEEATAELRRLAGHDAHYTSAQMADRLGEIGIVVSRSAVIAKLKRAKIQSRNATAGASLQHKSHLLYRRRWEKVTGKVPKGESRHEQLHSIESGRPDLPGAVPFCDRKPLQCAWIPGDPAYNALCCGNKTMPGLSYCVHHCQMVYRAA